jgi:hypothetical protein
MPESVEPAQCVTAPAPHRTVCVDLGIWLFGQTLWLSFPDADSDSRHKYREPLEMRSKKPAIMVGCAQIKSGQSNCTN